MQEKSANYFSGKVYGPVIVAAILKALSLIYVNFALGWCAISFLFLALFHVTDIKKAFRQGLVFGLVSALLLNYWMLPVVQSYAGGSAWLGMLCLLVTTVVMALAYGGQLALYAWLRLPGETKPGMLLNGLLLASLWVLAEWLRMQCFAGIPSLNYSLGITQASHLYLLQPAAWGSVYLLSFSLVLANYFIGLALYRRQWQWLAGAGCVFALHIAAGFWAYRQVAAQTALVQQPRIRTALVLASLPPEAVWDENNGPALVQQLLDLNRQAIGQQPDFVLWSETIVPWTYTADDDFLQAILRSAAGRDIHSLMGLNTAANATGTTIHNSAYFFNPAGQVQARYDKQQLLTVVERPLLGEASALILPFLAGSGLKMQPGAQARALATPWGKAGVLICNESVIPASTRAYAQNGVSFLVNLGNDGWFSDFYFPRQHFYNGRLRAVEARKDLVINNNRGVSGLIRASGEIAARFQPRQAAVQVVEIRPNHLEAAPTAWFIGLMLALLLIITCLARLKLTALYPV